MSISVQRLARRGLRRTPLSGTIVPADHECLPTWHQIVADSIPADEVLARVKRRKVLDEEAAMDAIVREVDHPFSGRNRGQRRERLRGTGILGSYTRDLHETFGKAWTDNLSAHRAMRQNAANAALIARTGGLAQAA